MEVNITGSYNTISIDTLNALKKATASNGKLEALDIPEIEKAVALDSNITEGEKLLVDNLKASLKDENVITNLSFFDSVDKNSNNSVNLRIKGDKIYSNFLDGSDIKSSQNTLKKTNAFSQKLASLSNTEQEQLVRVLDKIKNKPPTNQKELNIALNKSNPKVKEAINTLVGVAKEPETIKTAFAGKTIKALPDYVNAYSKLSPKEQEVTNKVFKLLSDKVPQSDYRKQIKNMMDSLPRDRSMEVGKTLNKLNIYLPSTTLSAPTSEDASARIKTMYMGDYNKAENEPNADYIRDALEVGRKEGFTVTVQVSDKNRSQTIFANVINDLQKREGMSLTEAQKTVSQHLKVVITPSAGYEWSEDNKFITLDGQLKTLPKLEQSSKDELVSPADKALVFSASVPLSKDSPDYTREGIHNLGLLENNPDNVLEGAYDIQKNVTDLDQHINAGELGQVLNKKVDLTKTYNEGGNMLTGTLPNGEAYAVIGRDGILISTFDLEKKFSLDKENVPEFQKVPEKIKEMEQKGIFTNELLDDHVKRLKISRFIEKGQDPIARAKEFLAMSEIVKDEIFPKDVGIPSKNLVFIPQPDFHIDMHMRPSKPGTIMLNDYDETIKLLEEAKKHCKTGSDEQNQIIAMIKNTKQVKEVAKPFMDDIEKKLTDFGLSVKKVAGVAKNDDKNINFMNGVSGTSLGSNRQYYMVNSTTIKPIKDAYENYAKKTLDIDKVYWMGDSMLKNNLSSAEFSLKNFGGMDCREIHEEY